MSASKPDSPTRSALSNPETLEQIVDASAALIGLQIPDAFKAGVVSQLALNARLIAPLLDFTLPEDAIPASEHTP